MHMKIRARDPQAWLLADLVRPSVAEGKPSSADIFSVELKSMEDRDGDESRKEHRNQHPHSEVRWVRG